MENVSLLISALIFVAALATISKILHRRRRRKLPPGPKPWPIIGNINLIGSSRHKSLHCLSQKYGEIMQLKFGNIPVIIASSPEMAKQFLKIHDANFASRPSFAAGKYTAYNYSDMLLAPYGPHWKQGRRIYISEMLSAKKLDFFEPVRVEERCNLLSHLHSLSGKPVLINHHLKRYLLTTLGRITLGDKYFTETTMSEKGKCAYELDEVQEIIDEWILVNGFFNIGDWIPWLGFLDLQGYVKRMKELRKKLNGFHNYVIGDHLARRADEKDEISSNVVVDALLKMSEDPNLEVKLTRDRIKGLSQNLIIGGTDTAVALLEWAIHELMRHPRVIDKAKQELDTVIGRSRWAEESDFPQLPYLNAIFKESMRLHPVSALLPPHYAIDDCKVAGYDISKGTVVIVNTYSIGRGPNSWDSPEEFWPERFMGKDFDVTGSNFALLPFGSGRRICPGYKLGLKVVQTVLSNLLHGFDLRLVAGMRAEDVCVDDVYGLVVHPKRPLSIIMEPTLPPHLY